MRMSVGGRIFLGIALVQLVSAAVILGGFLYTVHADLTRLTGDKAQDAVLRAIEATEVHFRPAEAAVLAAGRLLRGGVIDRSRPDQLERYLFEQLGLHAQFAGAYVGYPDGGFHYVMRSGQETVGGTRTKVIAPEADGRSVTLVWRDTDYAAVKTQSDPDDTFDPRTRAWYRAAAEGDGSNWTEPYLFFSSRKPGITAATAVRDGDAEVAAVVGVDIEMTEISSFLTQIALGLGGSAYIVAPGGAVIAHSSFDLVLPDGLAGDDPLRFRKVNELRGFEGTIGERVLAGVADPSGTRAEIISEPDGDGIGYIVALGRMAEVNWPWQIVVIAPQTNLVEVALASDLVLVGIILLATGLTCALGFALSRSIGRPLAALHRTAGLARHGNLELMEEIASPYAEINETAQTLHELAEERRRGGGHR